VHIRTIDASLEYTSKFKSCKEFSSNSSSMALSLVFTTLSPDVCAVNLARPSPYFYLLYRYRPPCLVSLPLLTFLFLSIAPCTTPLVLHPLPSVHTPPLLLTSYACVSPCHLLCSPHLPFRLSCENFHPSFYPQPPCPLCLSLPQHVR
jgi:hypothetical protein